MDRAGSDNRLYRRHGDQVAGLLHRIDVALDWRLGRSVQFIAARAGEGVSTIAWAYARAAADMRKRRILLLDAQGEEDAPPPASAGPGIAGLFAQGRPLAETAVPAAPLLWTTRLWASPAAEVYAAVERNEFWDALTGGFDEVVIDSPPAVASRLGLLMSSHVDSVIVVVEAEKTRGPVVAKLIDDLHDAEANIVGLVLNKRRYYVPQWLYRRL